MDHLDALKERLKLLPTSPEFKEPMAGETEAFYRSVKAKNDTLWDGWLQIMEVLDKAQKLADRSGSLFSKTALERGRKADRAEGVFQGDREPVAGDRQGRRPPRQGTRGGTGGPRGDQRGTSQAWRGARSHHQARPADQALPGRARLAHRRDQPGRCPDDRRPDGNTERAGSSFEGSPTLCWRGSSGSPRCSRMPSRSR